MRKKEQLDSQLNRRNIFAVRYAFAITLCVAVAISGLLLYFKIGNESVLVMAVRYYLGKK